MERSQHHKRSVIKRKISRTSQYLSERLDDQKASKLDADILELRGKLLVFNEFIAKIQAGIREYLFPHPVNRIKTAWKSSYRRVSGHEYGAKYPHPETNLARRFAAFAENLNETTPYTESLKESGKSFLKLSELRDLFEADLRRKFLYPLQATEDELQEMSNQLTKVEKRRLDYDHSRKNTGRSSTEDLENSKKRFHSSKRLFSSKMKLFLEREHDHLSALLDLTHSFQAYHHACCAIMDALLDAHQANIRKTEDSDEMFLRSQISDAASVARAEEDTDTTSQLSESCSIGTDETDELFCLTPQEEYCDDFFHWYLLPKVEPKPVYRSTPSIRGSAPALPRLKEDEEQ